jgi:hypothetical protein
MPYVYKSPFACTVCRLQDWRWTFKGLKSSLSQVSGNLAVGTYLINSTERLK